MASSIVAKTPSKTPAKPRGTKKEATPSTSSMVSNKDKSDCADEISEPHIEDDAALNDNHTLKNPSDHATPELEQEHDESQDEDMDMDQEHNYGTDGATTTDPDIESVPDKQPSNPLVGQFKVIDNQENADDDIDMGSCDCCANEEEAPFIQAVRDALRKKQWRDLHLKTADGKVVQGHKVAIVRASDLLERIFIKTPSKREVSLPFPEAVVKAALRYCYNGSYCIDPSFKSEWDLEESGKDASNMEYHFKVLQLAVHMGMPKLEELAGKQLKAGLRSGTFGPKLYAKLQEVPVKKNKKVHVQEVPFAVTEAVIEGGARVVKKKVDDGMDLNKAFHEAADTIDTRFLAELIQAIGNALGQQFCLYLRCPNCACQIRSKEADAEHFVCAREDCGGEGKQPLGQLLLDDRIPNVIAA